MPIIAGFMVPHPPLIVHEVGKGEEEKISTTKRAYEEVAKQIAELEPETIIISSPHSIMYSDYFHISPGNKARGNFGNFRAAEVSFEETYDAELVDKICELSEQIDFPCGTLGEREKALDHGTMVPLYFIRQKYREGKLLRIGLSGLPLSDHYRLGMMIKDAVDA
ncbi:MAG: AmmeMemoRadiSam system protein A, partial [Erysipelotrichaceae bacterium]|nr:AmmeMemoRadiSam system protein A [Erysipelotrichaceae bacterium]